MDSNVVAPPPEKLSSSGFSSRNTLLFKAYSHSAFLVPYCVMLVLGGHPALLHGVGARTVQPEGRHHLLGPPRAALKGVGFQVVCIAFYVDFFYNVILAWSLRFFFASFTTELPWTNCNNEWNTRNCREIGSSYNDTDDFDSDDPSQDANRTTTPAEEYWKREVLQIQHSGGIQDLGIIKWDLALCLLAVYLICYFSLWKGISTSGKPESSPRSLYKQALQKLRVSSKQTRKCSLKGTFFSIKATLVYKYLNTRCNCTAPLDKIQSCSLNLQPVMSSKMQAHMTRLPGIPAPCKTSQDRYGDFPQRDHESITFVGYLAALDLKNRDLHFDIR
nr:sodium-dependent dopamine transporter-like [Penaeus vannamei]